MTIYQTNSHNPKRKQSCRKLTNENVDQRLVGRNIERVGDVQRTNTKSAWKCIPLGHTWMSTPDIVLNKLNGCPVCLAAKKNLSNDIVDEKICDRSITRLGNVVGTHVKIEWSCKKCNHQWIASPNNVLSRKSGCPKCGKNISKPEAAWLNEMNVPGTKSCRQVSIKINGKLFKVDGYVSDTNTVYEFWGDYWHGNPLKYKSTDLHPLLKKPFGALYEATLLKRQSILNAGYNLIETWESEWLSHAN